MDVPTTNYHWIIQELAIIIVISCYPVLSIVVHWEICQIGFFRSWQSLAIIGKSVTLEIIQELAIIVVVHC